MRTTRLKLLMLSVTISGLLAACAVPAAIQPVREVATPMPTRTDGVTVVTGNVAGYQGGAGTIGVSSDVRGNEVNYASGTIAADGSFTLELQVPPRNALFEVRDAWVANLDIISSNPQARLAFIYYYAIYEGRERPSGWIHLDTAEDPDEDPAVGDMYAAYVYANEPTRIRINASAASGGHRYVSDLNLARGWNRVLTETVSVVTGVVTVRESVDYSTAVPWRFEPVDD